jgi:hypothetical protein
MEMFLKPKRPMNLRFKPAAKISFDLTQQNSPWLWKKKILRRPMECKSPVFRTDAKARLCPPYCTLMLASPE